MSRRLRLRAMRHPHGRESPKTGQLGHAVRQACTPLPQLVTIGQLVIVHVAPSGQASVQLEVPGQSIVQSPEHVKPHEAVPLQVPVLLAPIDASHPDVPGQSTLQLSPHARSQRALPSQTRFTAPSDSTLHSVPPRHEHVFVASSHVHSPVHERMSMSSSPPHAVTASAIAKIRVLMPRSSRGTRIGITKISPAHVGNKPTTR
jgi:hypothetical protein